MLLRKKLQQSFRLYLILDTQVHDYSQLLVIAKKAIGAGVDIIQLRDKQGSAKNIIKFSEKLLSLTRGRIPYIINDRVDLALVCQADGVHLGQEDISLKDARKIVGEKIIVGVSCQTVGHAKKAQEQGADYIGFGSVFKTLTKPERVPMNLTLLKRIVKNIKIPTFAIGGITLDNLFKIQSVGIKRIAVCRSVSEASNVGSMTQKFQEALRSCP